MKASIKTPLVVNQRNNIVTDLGKVLCDNVAKEGVLTVGKYGTYGKTHLNFSLQFFMPCCI